MATTFQGWPVTDVHGFPIIILTDQIVQDPALGGRIIYPFSDSQAGKDVFFAHDRPLRWHGGNSFALLDPQNGPLAPAGTANGKPSGAPAFDIGRWLKDPANLPAVIVVGVVGFLLLGGGRKGGLF